MHSLLYRRININKECKFHCLLTRPEGHQLTYLCCVHIGIWHVWTVHTLKTYIRTNEGIWYDKSRPVTLKYTVYIYDQRGNVNIYTITTRLALFFSVQIFAHVCSWLSLIRAVIKNAHLLQCRIFFILKLDQICTNYYYLWIYEIDSVL